MSNIDPKARTWAEIDMAALKHNFEIAKRTGKKVLCVIKANAYGHGAVHCGLFLEKQGADFFAVACLSEAIELREGGITKPILILGYTPEKYAETLAKYDITQAVQDERTALEFGRYATEAGVNLNVHVKIDTGMSRTGIFAQGEEAALAAADTIERIYNIPGITVKGMFTHFSVADTPSEDEYTAWQFKNYTTVLNALTAKGLRPEVCHASNSAAILAHPEAHLDMVREGIILYGMYPDSEPRKGELKPVLTLKSRVAQVRDLPAGTSISYGRTFISDKPIRTAVITAGYADGHPRRISNASYDMIHGKKFKQVGRICMDMHMIDVTGDDSVKVGDEVTLWGGAGMTAEEVGKVVGTINYELTCLITPRVSRVYINED